MPSFTPPMAMVGAYLCIRGDSCICGGVSSHTDQKKRPHFVTFLVTRRDQATEFLAKGCIRNATLKCGACSPAS